MFELNFDFLHAYVIIIGLKSFYVFINVESR